jgi:putative spermidine/putrescine transport system ATP-binding protein
MVEAGQTSVRVKLDAGGMIDARAPITPVAPGGRVVVCLRPEHMRFVAEGADTGRSIAGVVEMGLPLGPTVVHEVRVGGGTAIRVSEPRIERATVLAPGAAVRLSPIHPGLVSVFPAAAVR